MVDFDANERSAARVDGSVVEPKGGVTKLRIAADAGMSDGDRRRVPRRAVRGSAMAVFDGNGTVGALVRVALLDESLGGLAVLSPVPVEAGAQFSIVPEAGIGLKQIGEVANCEFTPLGYRLGLRNRTLRAAM
jgi:hypothetical protein